MALGLEEREAHRAADQDRVGALEERVEHADLVGHLRAADDRDERRAAGPRGCRCSVVDLALEQPARRRSAAGARRASVEACARCAAPNASLT